jgi:hypothetical protein
MQLRPQRFMRLVQVVGGRDDHRIQLIRLEQFLEVGEHIRNRETIGQCARLCAIVVAECDERCPPELRENGNVRQLGNRTRADDGDPYAVLHTASRENRTADGPRYRSIRKSDRRAGIVVTKNRPRIVPRPGASDRPPLAHADAVAVAVAAQRQPGEPITTARLTVD